jgi:hypothetical protein
LMILGVVATLAAMFFVGLLVNRFIQAPLESYSHRLFRAMCAAAGLNVVQAALAIWVVSAGIGAFYFKQFSPGWYGVLEVVFAMIGAFYAAKGLSLDEPFRDSSWWAIGACVYILQEGVSIITEAWKPGLSQGDSVSSPGDGVGAS